MSLPIGRVDRARRALHLHWWLRVLRQPSRHESGVAPKTYVSYRGAIRSHFIPALGAVELTALRPTHIQGLYTRMLASGRCDGRGGLAARSVIRYHQILHAALHQAVRWQMLVRNPADAAEPPRAPRRELATVTPEQARRLMASADQTPLGAFVRLAFLTGMRRGELLGLRWADLDLDGATVHVQQTAQWITGQGIVFRHPKTRLSRRAIALSPTPSRSCAAIGVGRRKRGSRLALPTSTATSCSRPVSEPRSSPAICGDRGCGSRRARVSRAFESTTCGTHTRRSCSARASTRRSSANASAMRA